jgi:multidrug efflux pump subunit AcrB
MHTLRCVALSLALALLASLAPAAGGQPPKEPSIGSLIRVEATFPGANADYVQAAFATPLNNRLLGLDGAVRVVFQCTDERGVATVYFRETTKGDQALASVQKRVDLVASGLPDAVKIAGITVHKHMPGDPALWLAVTADAGVEPRQHAETTAALRAKLAGLAGVYRVDEPGADSVVRIWIDPAKLGDRGLTGSDVPTAIRSLIVDLKAAKPDTGKAEASLTPKELGELVVKTTDDGKAVRLKDVAEVKLEPGALPLLNGQPTRVLGIMPAGVPEAVELAKTLPGLAAEWSKKLPKGLVLTTALDATGEAVVLEISGPASLKGERMAALVASLDKDLATLKDAKSAKGLFAARLCLPAPGPNSLPNEARIVLQLPPAKDRAWKLADAVKAVRGLAAKASEARLRVRGQTTWTHDEFPVDLLLIGPNSKVRDDFAQRFTDKLKASGLVDDLARDDHSPTPGVQVDPDPKMAQTFGVLGGDVSHTVQLFFGGLTLHEGGRTHTVVLQLKDHAIGDVKQAKLLKFRNLSGELVPLVALARVREVPRHQRLTLLGDQQAIHVTADLAPEATLEQIRERMVAIAAEARKGLTKAEQYKVVDLGGR